MHNVFFIYIGTNCIYDKPESGVTVGCPAIALEDSPALKNCKYLCDDEDKCRGLTFSYDLDKCSLYNCHDTTKVSVTSNTTPTSFIRKICGCKFINTSLLSMVFILLFYKIHFVIYF
jgi:hypothetical protein